MAAAIRGVRWSGAVRAQWLELSDAGDVPQVEGQRDEAGDDRPAGPVDFAPFISRNSLSSSTQATITMSAITTNLIIASAPSGTREVTLWM